MSDNENTPAPKQTFADTVNDTVGKMTQGEDGNWALPEGLELDEPTQYAVTAERRRRDTQAAYSKAQGKLKALEVENTELAKGWESDVAGNLSATQRAELEELKATDPDQWRQKLNDYETEARTAFGEKRTEISKKASHETELESRTRLLEEFNTANPTIAVTDELLENDIPPRLTKQLANGDVDFGQFLANVKEYLGKGKVIAKGDVPPNDPNLANSGGTSTPSEQSVNKEMHTSYKNETY